MRVITDRDLLLEQIGACGLQERFSAPLADIACLHAFAPGETLIEKGRASDHLYFLTAGKVRFCLDDDFHRRVSYGWAQAGDPIGEMASLWQDKPLLSAQAAEACLCVAIDLTRHRERLLNDNLFLRYLCRALSRSVGALDLRIVSLARLPAASRVAACILQNARDGRFALSLAECAESASVSYRHLIRIMNRFCAGGLLGKRRQRYFIEDREKLAALVEDPEHADALQASGGVPRGC